MPSAKIKKNNTAFTILELIVSLAIFAILATAMIGSYSAVAKSTKVAREKIILASLATNYLEIVRNMPYSQVGTIVGDPNGPLPDLPNKVSQTISGTIYYIYYRVDYIHDPSDPNTAAADYKQVKMSIQNTSTGQITDFVTTVTPKGLISNPNSGALQVSVINSQGQILSGANVNITYPTSSPYTYNLPDTTNSSGQVTEVGLIPAVNDYRVVATEPGYSTDQTYPITAQNPSPVHPDATIASGTVTQLTLSIDKLSNLNIDTLNATCQSLSGVNVQISGSKIIGTPDVLKFQNNYSSSNGVINLNNIEWDTYTPTLLSGQNYIVYGTSPVQAISVLPGTSQTYTMILGSNSTQNSLLVLVKDGSTGAALENASVTLTDGGGTSQVSSTGGSVWLQNDWSGGSGQTQWSSGVPNQYFQDNGTVDISNPGVLQLKNIGGSYVTATATLESATFDTGTSQTNYTILNWQPSSQSASTTLEFQIAANNDNSTWNYVGPDGTSNTYFITPGNDMGSSLDNNRYFRYKAFLATSDPTKTPVLTSVGVNYVSGCFTPGQVIFTGLNNATYYLTVSLAGYQTQSNIPINVNGNQFLQVLMGQ